MSNSQHMRYNKQNVFIQSGMVGNVLLFMKEKFSSIGTNLTTASSSVVDNQYKANRTEYRALQSSHLSTEIKISVL